jgi:VWFA-related protein
MIFCVGFLLLVLVATFKSQDKQDSQGSGTNFKIQIGVEEVRLDAVVLDKKGHQITDLTADDFEIYQDRRQQKVLSSKYIVDQIQPGSFPFHPKDSTPPPFPASLLARDTIRRVIVFVVDDLGMTFEDIYHTRMALQRFLEKQMQPGDLVAILPTHGSGALHMFSSDKMELLAKIRNLRWTAPLYYIPFSYIPIHGSARFRYIAVNRSPASIIKAVRYAFLALQNLPGRKEILILSTQPGVNTSVDSPDLVEQANRLSDSALRTGIVVHSLNISGLEAPFADGLPDRMLDRVLSPLNMISGLGSPFADGLPDRMLDSLLGPFSWAALRNDPLRSIVKKTGGIYLENNNFFLDGIGSVNDAINGYYLLSYTPPPDTFKQGENIYHRVVIKVKRRGAEIHTRDGFFGVSQVKNVSLATRNSLYEALFSPLQYEDLKVSLSSGFVKDDREGYLLRSWVYVNAAGLSIIDKEKERFVSLETACVTSDLDGYVLGENNRVYDQIETQQYIFRVKDENIPWVREHGLRFNLVLPVKKPGSYYVHMAAKDEVTGKLGSAYQFIQIPEIKKDRLALSNLFFISSAEDISWIQSGMTREEHPNLLNPDMRHDSGRSPAFKSYLPGEVVDYMAIVYNATADKGSGPDLECQSFLYRNGELIYKSNPEAVNLGGVTDYSRIPIMKRLTLDNKMLPGDYMLRLLVTDKEAEYKRGSVTRQIDFQVVEKPAAD